MFTKLSTASNHKCVYSLLFAIFTFILKSNSESKSTCNSTTCFFEAQRIQSKLNLSVDPCSNFYEFSCGGFKPKLLKNQTKVDSFSIILDAMEEKLNLTMSESMADNEIRPFKDVKTFYRNCMDTGKIFTKVTKV